MTSHNHRLSLEEVLDEFFFAADEPSAKIVLRACEAYPEYREDIMEFAALWSTFESSPDPESSKTEVAVSDESVLRLQSFVLNHLDEIESKSGSGSDESVARAALAQLAGGKLRTATAAAGLGNTTSLMTKILTKRISNVPRKVFYDLANHLNISMRGLQQSLGPDLVGGMSYKASGKPNISQMETWESAINDLPVSQEEKARLLALRDNENSP